MLDICGRLEQPEAVLDVALVLADPFSQAADGVATLIDEGLERLGLFERSEIAPLDVLGQADLD